MSPTRKSKATGQDQTLKSILKSDTSKVQKVRTQKKGAANRVNNDANSAASSQASTIPAAEPAATTAKRHATAVLQAQSPRTKKQKVWKFKDILATDLRTPAGGGKRSRYYLVRWKSTKDGHWAPTWVAENDIDKGDIDNWDAKVQALSEFIKTADRKAADKQNEVKKVLYEEDGWFLVAFNKKVNYKWIRQYKTPRKNHPIIKREIMQEWKKLKKRQHSEYPDAPE